MRIRSETLRQCLQASTIPIALWPSSPEWSFAVKPYNTRLAPGLDPLSIVYRIYLLIAAAVDCARYANVPAIARSGGHSYGAYSLGGSFNGTLHESDGPNTPERSLIIDLRSFQTLSYAETEDVVTVGSGVLLGEMNEYLEKRGRLVPTGSCPTVGVGGQVLAGGFGMSSRYAGLFLDNLISMEVILADGRQEIISEDHMPDLFWGMRGAGSSLAIAHTFHIRTHPAPPAIVYYELTLLPRSLPPDVSSAQRAAEFYVEFEDFGESEHLVSQVGMFSWHVTPEPDQDGAWGTKVEVLGQYMGDETAFDRIIQKFIARLKNRGEMYVNLGVRKMSFLEGMHLVGGDWTQLKNRGPLNINEHVNFYAKSLLTKSVIPFQQMTAHMTTLLQLSPQHNPSTGVDWFVLSPFLGGSESAITKVPMETTAFAHRDLRMVWEPYAKQVEESAGTNDLVSFVGNMAKDLLPVDAVYPAYVDPELSASQYPKLIWGRHYPRLQAIKAKCDNHDVFRHPQSVKRRTSSLPSSAPLVAMIAFGAILVFVLRIWRRRVKVRSHRD